MKQVLAVLAMSCVLFCQFLPLQGMDTAGGAKEPKAWWPQFLGVHRNGMSAEKNLNTIGTRHARRLSGRCPWETGSRRLP